MRRERERESERENEQRFAMRESKGGESERRESERRW